MTRRLLLGFAGLVIAASLCGCMKTRGAGPPAEGHNPGPKIILTAVLLDSDDDGTLDIYETYLVSDDGTGSHGGERLLEPGKSVKEMGFKIRRELADIPNAQFYCDGARVPTGSEIHLDVKGRRDAQFAISSAVTRVRWKYTDANTPATKLELPSHGDVPIPLELARLKGISYMDGAETKDCHTLVITRKYK